MSVVADGRDRDQLGKRIQHDVSFALNIDFVVPRRTGSIDVPDLRISFSLGSKMSNTG